MAIHAPYVGHSAFFDAILALIPAKHYVRAEEDGDEQHWDRFAQNKAGKAPKQAIKEASKKAKRTKFDPSQPTTALQVQQQQAEHKTSGAATGASSTAAAATAPATAAAGAAPASGGVSKGAQPAASVQELRERLRAKIEELRAKRKARDSDANGDDDDDDDEDQDNAGKEKNAKRQRTRQRRGSVDIVDDASDDDADAADGDATNGGGDDNDDDDHSHDDDVVVPESIDYGKFTFDTSSLKKPEHKSKQKDLKKLLAKAQANQQRLEQLSGEERKAAKLEQSWDAAFKRAAGEKVLDDPKLLKRSLKRKEKAKKKSAQAWAVRTKQQESSKKERQKTRTQHIQDHRAAKMAKRRPGFEGKRQTVIN